MRIKTRGNDNQVRLEVRRHLIQRRFETAFLLDSRCGCTQREIQREPEPAPCSFLSARSCARIPWILMRREEEDGWIVVEDSLCAVAVMNVPVKNRDFLNLRILLLRVSRRHGHVVE